MVGFLFRFLSSLLVWLKWTPVPHIAHSKNKGALYERTLSRSMPLGKDVLLRAGDIIAM